MSTMNKITTCFLALLLLTGSLVSAEPEKGGKSQSACDTSTTTICTIEIWLAHPQSKKDVEIRQFLKDKSIKVLRSTIQYWKPTGGHPPTNIAIGGGVSADDARMVIDLALKYNDKIESLILQRLNSANYVAIGHSAWDENSQIPVTAENLQRLIDPKLTAAEFHTLYVELTGEKNIPQKPFY